MYVRPRVHTVLTENGNKLVQVYLVMSPTAFCGDLLILQNALIPSRPVRSFHQMDRKCSK